MKLMAGVAKSEALQGCFSDVVTAISASDPLKVGDELFTASLVSQETLDKLDLPTHTAYLRSRTLVMAVLNQVKLVPEKLDTFMQILKKCVDKFSFDAILSHMNGVGLPLPTPKKPRLSTESSPIELYGSYLRSKYLKQKIADNGKWPSLPSKRYINLAVIERGRLAPDDTSQAFLYCDITNVKSKSEITFQEIAVPDEDNVLPELVLVEGAPGVGKSTFAWEACRKWAEGEILEAFKLVILIRLRDTSIRKATCLGDLIQYPCDPTIRQKVIDEITKTGGKGVLLLLEGYDELPAFLREESSLFKDLIKGNQFQEGTLLVTSRHWASQPLLLPHSTNRRVSQHIEILGFTEKDIGDYLTCMLQDTPHLLNDVEQYLKLYPHICSMMYIPLNCAIVLEVYRYSKKENVIIPKTMTELYSTLIRSLLLRHMCELPEYQDKLVALEDLHRLPACIKHHFHRLCKLAYLSLFTRKQQIIFSAEEIPCDLDGLGLMQSSMELFVDGAKKSFNFLHLTIQEYLAACYIELFPLNYRVYFFTRYENEVNTMAIRFLAGLSPATLNNALLSGKSTTSSLKCTMEDIHRLFEANLQPPPHVIGDPSEPVGNPFSSYILGHLVAKSSSYWDIYISGQRDVKTIEMFTYSASAKGDSSLLSLHIQNEDYKHSDIEELLNVPFTIEQLEVKPYFESSEVLKKDTRSIAKDTEDKISTGVKHLCLSKLKVSNTEAEKLTAYLSSTSSISMLSLVYCKFKSRQTVANISQGVEACRCLQQLNLAFSPYLEAHYNRMFEMLQGNKSLSELHVTCDLYGACELANALCGNLALRVLVIEGGSLVVEGDSLDYVLDNNDVAVAVAELLSRNKALVDFNLANIDLSTKDICIIAEGLHRNSTLERFNISHSYIETEGSESLAEMLKQNRTLEHLNLSSCCLGRHGASILAEALCDSSLKTLSVSVESIGEAGALAFASVLEKNTTLKELLISDVFSFLHKTAGEWVSEFIILSNALQQNQTLERLKVIPPSYFQTEAIIEQATAAECAKDNRISTL